MKKLDVVAYNRKAWDQEVAQGNPWTRPVGEEEITAAREGRWEIVLTPRKPVPASWFPPLEGTRVLCLASGGGQQGPILAAAGALVTVLDNSPKQLAQDRLVAEREGLPVDTVLGDMADLSAFADETFGLIVHPVSNCFAPDLAPVWREAFRVLAPGGRLLAGFANPIVCSLDPDLEEKGICQLKHAIPYSDIDSLTEKERRRYTDKGEPLMFGHSLTQQIGGQLAAGFVLQGFFEDYRGNDNPLDRYLPGYIATMACKP